MLDNNRYKDLIKTRMPWLEFKKPLFYNSDIGIRFEIGNPSIGLDTQYLMSAKDRATDIFEDLFSEGDVFILVINVFRDVSQISNNEIVLTHQVTECVFDCESKDVEVIYEIMPNFYDEDDKEGKIIRFYFEVNFEKLNYKELISRICNMDFKHPPYIEDEVYIVCYKRSIVYYLYDDRGLDVVSNDVASLKNLYVKRNNWILDYDRKRINKIFIL